MSDDATPQPARPDKEQLRRERDLLLSRFDPSEFNFPSSGELTWGPGNPPTVVDEFLYPERPDGAAPERPAGSEETSA